MVHFIITGLGHIYSLTTLKELSESSKTICVGDREVLLTEDEISNLKYDRIDGDKIEGSNLYKYTTIETKDGEIIIECERSSDIDKLISELSFDYVTDEEEVLVNVTLSKTEVTFYLTLNDTVFIEIIKLI